MGVFIELSGGGFAKFSEWKAGSKLSGPEWHSGGGGLAILKEASGPSLEKTVRSRDGTGQTSQIWVGVSAPRNAADRFGGMIGTTSETPRLWWCPPGEVSLCQNLPLVRGEGSPARDPKKGGNYWVIKCPVRQSPPKEGLFFLVDTWV